jgi:hypothetical protein
MNTDRNMLTRIDSMPAPRHLFVLPAWLNSAGLDRLLEKAYVNCDHLQRDGKGAIQVAMGLELTIKGKRLIHPEIDWRNLAVKGSLAGASFTVMSLLILYLG